MSKERPQARPLQEAVGTILSVHQSTEAGDPGTEAELVPGSWRVLTGLWIGGLESRGLWTLRHSPVLTLSW